MQERKIPTLIGLLLVAIAVMVFRFAFDRISPYMSRASAIQSPQNVTISNITDTAFTVSWLTQEQTTGAIVVEGITSPFYDDRQLTPSSSSTKREELFFTHSVSIRNSNPDTTYKFRILSGGKIYTDNGNAYEVRTAPLLNGTGTNLEPAYGQVTTPTDLPAEGSLVYLTMTNGQTLSTLVNTSGSWVIPLNLVRTQDLTRFIEPAERIDESIVIRSPEGEASALTDSLNDNPVPAMTIGKTYDFRKIQANNLNENKKLAEAPPAVLGTQTSQAAQTIAITKPAQGAAIPSNLPLIQGTGLPGKNVLVVVGIQNPLSASVTVGADGIWRYTPERPLHEGKQSVTITTQNAQNQTKAITHTFEILKSGTQVLGDATPSATIEPTPTLDETPSPTATLTGEEMPTSGNELPLIIMLILGATLLLGGGSLLFL
jgi:hypothetical protein